MPEYANLNKEELRNKLLAWLLANPMSINMLAKEIGVALRTLAQFLDKNDKRKPNMKLLLQVNKFLRDKNDPS